jgi:signal transduction histidine kinase
MPIFDLLHALLIGTMCYQFIFMLLQWYVFRRKDYLYYITYMGCTLLFLLIRIDGNSPFLPVHATGMVDEYLDQPLIIFAFWMYVRFGYHFLDLRKNQQGSYKAALGLERVFIVYLVIKCFMIPFGLSPQTSSYIYLFVTLFITIRAAPLLYALLRQRNLLNNFLVVGGVCVTLGGLSGPVYAFCTGQLGEKNMAVYVGLELAILIELLLLNTGLIIKNKRIQQEVIDTQQELIRQLRQTDQLRTNLSSMQSKLSADLHDNIGAGLSSIAIYSEIARQKLKRQPESVAQVLNLIGITASEVIGEMKDTIWFIQPSNSTFVQMMDRLRQYVEPLCVEKEIKLHMLVNEQPDMEKLTLLQKKNIYLIIKEAINNALKHADANEIGIHIRMERHILIAQINDDGTGMVQQEGQHQGNGILNIRKRTSDVNGTLDMSSDPVHGTEIIIKVPLGDTGQ